MKRPTLPRSVVRSFFALLAALAIPAAIAQVAAPQHFRVALPSSADGPLSGRLLVFMRCAGEGQDPERIEIDPFRPDSAWVAAQDVSGLLPGTVVDVRAGALAYPQPFSQAPACSWDVQAVLDVGHSYNRDGRGPDDWESAVTRWNGRPDAEPLQLARRPEARVSQAPLMGIPPIVTPGAQALFEIRSARLSRFWGREVPLRGWVVLPPEYEREPTRRYPTVYWTHGFGVPVQYAQQAASQIHARMQRGQLPPMIWVMLEQRYPQGTHEFTDSANGGPWGSALIEEFIPALERRYRTDSERNGRLLMGHSSGGWATLQLQLRYPKVFGGVWSTAPDPVDFRSFLDTDLYTPRANLYRTPDGRPRPMFRAPDGSPLGEVEQFAKAEAVLGPYGGQLASFEWVFSPRGRDGMPLPVFDRVTGDVDLAVARYWRERYDLSRQVQAQWPRYGDLLRGRLHLYVGTMDTIWLDAPVRLLEQRLRALDARAQVTYVSGRTHLDLYTVGNDELGLFDVIGRQMYDVARPGNAWRGVDN